MLPSGVPDMIARALLATAILCVPAPSRAQATAAQRIVQTDGWIVTGQVPIEVERVAGALEARDREVAWCVDGGPAPAVHPAPRLEGLPVRVRFGLGEGWRGETESALSDCIVAALNAEEVPGSEGGSGIEIRLRSTPQPRSLAEAREARVELAGDTQLRIRTSAPGVVAWLRPVPRVGGFWSHRPWRRACVNCELTLHPGVYELGIGAPGSLRSLAPLLELDGPLESTVEYQNREGWRTLGSVLTGLGGIAFLAALVMLVPVGLANEVRTGSGSPGMAGMASVEPDYGAVAAGLAIGGIVALLVGAPFAFFHDHRALSSQPIALGSDGDMPQAGRETARERRLAP